MKIQRVRLSRSFHLDPCAAVVHDVCAKAGDEVVLRLNMSGGALRERCFNAQMLGLASSLLGNPLEQPLIRFVSARNF